MISRSFKNCVAAVCALSMTGCGGSDGGSSPAVAIAVAPTPTPGPATATPTPTPAPAPTPTPTPAATIADLVQLASIPSNFDTTQFIVKGGNNGAIPHTAAPDFVGAFRFICKPSHNAYNDPIVYPGQPGRSHLHTFFGNTKADAFSTYQSLRTTGDSTCNNPLNRSAYWIPALMNGRGKVVMPDRVSIYYKRRPASDPACTDLGKGCVPIPRGLRFVFGFNMNRPADAADVHFSCDGSGFASGAQKDLAAAAMNCPSGSELTATVGAPPCWNGTDLDSADHRSHMAFTVRGQDGKPRCPATHPWIVPTFTLSATYTTDDTLDRSGDRSPTLQTWYFSSDRMAGMEPRTSGTTFHSDWFGAWDDDVLNTWTDNCINKLLNCSAGELGDGTQLKSLPGFSFTANPRLVDPPTPPG